MCVCAEEKSRGKTLARRYTSRERRKRKSKLRATILRLLISCWSSVRMYRTFIFTMPSRYACMCNATSIGTISLSRLLTDWLTIAYLLLASCPPYFMCDCEWWKAACSTCGCVFKEIEMKYCISHVCVYGSRASQASQSHKYCVHKYGTVKRKYESQQSKMSDWTSGSRCAITDAQADEQHDAICCWLTYHMAKIRNKLLFFGGHLIVPASRVCIAVWIFVCLSFLILLFITGTHFTRFGRCWLRICIFFLTQIKQKPTHATSNMPWNNIYSIFSAERTNQKQIHRQIEWNENREKKRGRCNDFS